MSTSASYEGRTIALGPHLALGRGSLVACCRIYFWLDEERHAFVVGHVGNHLSDSTSGRGGRPAATLVPTVKRVP